MDIDDPLLEGFEEPIRMNAVVARIDDKLDPMVAEEITHGGVPLLRRAKAFLRKLSQRNALFARERRGAAGWAIRRHGHHIEPALDQVAQVRSLTGDRDADFQCQWMTTRSGPE